jgi:hypothetical protein
MTSVAPSAGGFSQSNGYFVTTAATTLQVYTPGSGSGGSFRVGSFAAGTGVLVTGANDVLRDMGKTVISSSRVFRKVQVVDDAANPIVAGTVPGGVGNSAGTAYRTGYIEIGGGLFGFGAAVVRPTVQYYPSLM